MHPSPIAGRCPTRAALAAYLQEELPPGDSEAVRVHVLSCPGCEAELRILDDEGDAPLRRFRTWLAGAAVGPPDRWYEQMAVVARGSFPPPADGPAPPERLGQYQLFGLIGRGGMGEVYRAKHLQLKKWVAVKLLHPARVDARAVARFEREIEVAGRLDHANIVRATDAGRADGFHYLVMELIDGADLARIVRRHGPLPVAEACELIRQAAVGLQHAHEHELVHRDIKPSNLMLSARGVVKVLDLGLARLRGDPTAGTLSVTGQVMGTADYMAPEQWEASHEVDIRADIYSLGCTLFTLLTGSPPFAGPGLDTLYKKLKAHHEAPVPPLSGGHPVPAELEKLVGRMLRKTPALRPQAPEEVARELAGYCVGSDLAWLTAANAGSPPGPCVSGSVETKSFQPSLTGRYPTTAPLMSARRRGPIRVVACLCVLAAAVVGYVVWGPDRNPTSDPDPRPEAGNIRPTAPPPVLPPRVFRPGEWCELLDRPPTVVRWPQNPENSAYEYDPVHRSLRVTCQDWGMLALGEVSGSGFDLDATFLQTPWMGDVGVFVRGREDTPRGSTRAVADTVLLERIPNQLAPDPARLTRGVVQKFVAPPQQLFNDLSAPSGTIPRPTGGTHRLSLSVGKTGLESVRWDGADVPELRRAANDIKRTGAGGSVGVWIQHGTAQFQSVRVRLHTLTGEHE